ncbi:IPT/TIG domain-containing protein, partial [Nocardioides albidus]|uniref:IPT/TIG domain-containing protein n=1 Tax=Nocardioides albidus TaxID=1517589 RepID=UPI0013054260
MTEIVKPPRPAELFPLELARRPLRLKEWLDKHLHTIVAPSISGVAPGSGPRGTVLTVTGGPFSATRWENDVKVGGAPAFVLAATTTQLKVL